MDASSGPAASVSTSLCGLVHDAARALPARTRAGVLRPDGGRHLRLPRAADRPARVPVPRADPHPDALDARLRPAGDIIADPHGLPFAENAVDLIVLPHALEFTDDPHLMLREAYRVIRPEGQIVIAGFNPFSLYGAKRYFGRAQTPPWNGSFIAPLPAQGLADAARLRRRRRAPRRLRAAVRAARSGCIASVLRGERRPLVADRRRRLLPARDQARARHAASSRPRGSGASGATRRSRRVTTREGSRRRPRPSYVGMTAAGRRHLHGWRLQRQSGARRLGRAPALRRAREGVLRRRGAHDQQPHGAHRRDPRAGVAEARLARWTSTPTRST